MVPGGTKGQAFPRIQNLQYYKTSVRREAGMPGMDGNGATDTKERRGGKGRTGRQRRRGKQRIRDREASGVSEGKS